MFQRHVSGVLSGFCHNELASNELRGVAEHLEECDRCRKECEEIRAGVELATYLCRVPAPESLWNEIQTAWEAGYGDAVPSTPRIAWQRPFVTVTALLLLLGLGALSYRRFHSSGGRQSPAEVDLNGYLTGVETSTPEAGYRAISRAPLNFQEAEARQVLEAARIETSGGIPPLPGYNLVEHRLDTVEGQDVAQLVYGRGQELFSVFVAPDLVRFGLGKRDLADSTVGGIRCRRVDCPRTSTFWFGAGGLHCLLVAKIADREEVEKIIRYFILAHERPGRAARDARRSGHA
jgi:anti-sigma factor RsiW